MRAVELPSRVRDFLDSPVREVKSCSRCGALNVAVEVAAGVSWFRFSSDGEFDGVGWWKCDGVCDECLFEMYLENLKGFVVLPPYEARFVNCSLRVKVGGRTVSRRFFESSMPTVLEEVSDCSASVDPDTVSWRSVLALTYWVAEKFGRKHVNPARSFMSDVALFSVATETDYGDLVRAHRNGVKILTNDSRVIGIMDRQLFESGGVFGVGEYRRLPYSVTEFGEITVRFMGKTVEYADGGKLRKYFGTNIAFVGDDPEGLIMIILRKHSVVLHAPRVE